MNGPHGAVAMTQKRAKQTKLGSMTCFCPNCRRTFHERTATPFTHLEFPTDLVLLAVVWRLRSQLSVREVAEMLLARGCAFTHEAMRDWETRCTPLRADQLRLKRHGQRGGILLC